MITILCEFNRKILRIFICTFLLLAVTIPNYALALSNTTLDRIVTQIESLYPPLEGYVIEVEGNGLTLDLKQGMQVKKGDRLKLIRYGLSLIHI